MNVEIATLTLRNSVGRLAKGFTFELDTLGLLRIGAWDNLVNTVLQGVISEISCLEDITSGAPSSSLFSWVSELRKLGGFTRMGFLAWRPRLGVGRPRRDG